MNRKSFKEGVYSVTNESINLPTKQRGNVKINFKHRLLIYQNGNCWNVQNQNNGKEYQVTEPGLINLKRNSLIKWENDAPSVQQ